MACLPARSSNAPTDWMPEAGLATSTSGKLPSPATGAKSRRVS
ncbi:Uncharacterised protein [Bordetella pertussis]|nr:Uncharacterised protein [Bordetella pertussis]